MDLRPTACRNLREELKKRNDKINLLTTDVNVHQAESSTAKKNLQAKLEELHNVSQATLKGRALLS